MLPSALAVFAGSALGSAGSLPAASARAVLVAAPLLGVLLSRFASLRCRTLRAVLLAVLAAGAALRADRAAGEGTPETLPHEVGVWSPSGGSSDRDFGSLGRGAPALAVARGSAAAGDALAALPGEPAVDLARGPEPGPAHESGIDRSAAERGPDEIVRLAAPERGLAGAGLEAFERLRAALLARSGRLEDPTTRGLVAGLLFGDLSALPHGLGDLFVRTGTFHVLAISGLQVALVAVLLAAPLARLLALALRAASAGRIRTGYASIRAALLVGFVPLAGAGPPVTRSALAWVVASISPGIPVRRPFATTGEAGTRRALRMPRTGDPLAIWSLALLVECLVHPDAPRSISVQLTYAATLGLILATGPLSGILFRALPGAGRISPVSAEGRRRPELVRIAGQKLLEVAVRAVAASSAAVLATSAVVWSRFGEWSPPGILATPAIGLPVAAILVGGWAWLVAPGLVPQAALDLPARAMIGILEGFDRLPATPCPLPPRPFLLLAAASGLALLALARLRRPGSGPQADRLGRAACAAWGALLLPWALAPASLEVLALDVGHGTACLVRCPGGGVWLFDAGSRDRREVGREAVAPLLRAWDASRIAFVLSHPDRDHDDALGWLLERHPPNLWAGALPAQLDARLPHTSPRLDVRRGRMLLPDLDASRDAPRIELSRGLDAAGNEGSRCLEIAWGDERIVLSGDAEEAGLAAWLAGDPPRAPLRLLLLPHHGSDTPLLGALLAASVPREVWISASGSPAVLGEIERRGIRCRTTSKDGPLRLELP